MFVVYRNTIGSKNPPTYYIIPFIMTKEGLQDNLKYLLSIRAKISETLRNAHRRIINLRGSKGGRKLRESDVNEDKRVGSLED